MAPLAHVWNGGTSLSETFDIAATAIWYYEVYNPLIGLMLRLYFKRPEVLTKDDVGVGSDIIDASSFARTYFQTVFSDRCNNY